MSIESNTVKLKQPKVYKRYTGIKTILYESSHPFYVTNIVFIYQDVKEDSIQVT